MRNKYFQNKVATSSFSLPVAALIATLLWSLGGPYTTHRLLCWVAAGLCTYLLIEFNSSNALIRIRSNLTATTFLFSIGCLPFLQENVTAIAASACLLLCYHFLFRSYQNTSQPQKSFYAFFSFGLACFVFPPIIILIPAIYWCMHAYLRSMSLKTLCASIVGLLIPFWFYTGFYFFLNNPEMILTKYHQFADFHMPNLNAFTSLGVPQILSFSLSMILGVISSIHALKTGHNDKIRTRMQLNTLIIMTFILGLFILGQPNHFNILLSLLIMTASPLISHFFALTSGRITNILFIVSIIINLSIAFIDIWNNCLTLLPSY